MNIVALPCLPHPVRFRDPKKHISISILQGYPYLIGLYYKGGFRGPRDGVSGLVRIRASGSSVEGLGFRPSVLGFGARASGLGFGRRRRGLRLRVFLGFGEF